MRHYQHLPRHHKVRLLRYRRQLAHLLVRRYLRLYLLQYHRRLAHQLLFLHLRHHHLALLGLRL